jgi:hypothetical protein
MADKRISQLIERTDIANNDVLPIVASGATTTNKVTISTIQDWMQDNLDVGVTSVGITFGTSGTDINASGSPVTSSGNITINLPTASATNRGALSSADWITFNSKQPAGNYVTLDTAQTITAQKTFTTSGSSDTMIISHGSGSGFALDVIKAGNNEAIRVTKTSGSGNAMSITGGNFSAEAATFSGVVTTTPDAVINGVNVGRGAGSISSNTRVGVNSIQVNTTGAANTGIGNFTLQNNTTGSGNTAIGSASMQLNTTGGSNTAIGFVSLVNNTTGNGNTATGAYALENNTTGSNNTAIGQEALENNIVGTFNTAVGHQALQDNTNSSNTAIGYFSLLNNTSGDANFAGGALSLSGNTTGRLNVSLGYASMEQNTTGSFNIAVGNDAGRFISGGGNNAITNNSIYIGSNTRPLANNQTNQIVIGHNAIGNGSNTVTIGNSSITNNYFTGNIRSASLITTADSTINQVTIGKGAGGSVDFAYNTAIGSGTLVSNTTGVFNTAVGFNALANHTTGNNQVALGLSAGRYINSGANNVLSSSSVYIGVDSRASASGNSNEIVIGHEARGNGSNTVTLGNDSITNTYLKGAVTLTGALNGTSASFNTTNAITLTASDSRIRGGDTTGRLLLANSGTTTYGIFYGSSHATLPNAIQFVNDNTPSLTLASTGAATFSSSVTAGGLLSTSYGIARVQVTSTTNSENAGFRLSANNSSGTAKTAGLYLVSGTTSANTFLALSANDNDYQFNVLANGNVGIGTPSPTNLLHLTGSSATPSLRLGSVSAGFHWDIGRENATTGDFVFNQTISGGSSTERMRITSGGVLQMSNNATTFSIGSIASQKRIQFESGGFGFYNAADGYAPTYASAFNVMSDYRLKEDLKEVNGLQKISQIKIYDFKWADRDERQDGVLAHELAEVLPYAVNREKDEVNEDGNILPQGVDYSKIVPVLIKAIQELKAEIDSLKTK